MNPDHSTLVGWIENAEQAQHVARRDSERDRDYKDGLQLDQSEIAALKKRGQPPVVVNFIKRKIDFISGIERQQRTDPVALPRTPMHEDQSELATDALRFVVENARYDRKRSRAFEYMIVEGTLALSVSVSKTPLGENEIRIHNIPWDRFIWDEHSSENDFSDARWLGIVNWFDKEEAERLYPSKSDEIDASFRMLSESRTYDDKPKDIAWVDSKRKRVMVVQIWYRADNAEWHFAEMTKGGILKDGISPYQDEHGLASHPIVAHSAYVDRNNNRFGLVAEMIDVQDEINKRRSKALHAMSVNQLWYEEGAFEDDYQIAVQMSRPDGRVKINPGFFDRVIDKSNTDLAASHVAMYQEAKSEMEGLGAADVLSGRGGDGKSGRAIQALQQGAYTELGGILDALRDVDVSVYRKVWLCVQQFWTEPKWLRVTDDENKLKQFMVNEPLVIPATGEIVGHKNRPAEIDVDIIIDDQPDIVSIKSEQFEILANTLPQLAQMPPQFAEALIEASSLRNKDKLISIVTGQSDDPEFQQKMQALQERKRAIEEETIRLQFAEKIAEIDNIESDSAYKAARAVEAIADASAAQGRA